LDDDDVAKPHQIETMLRVLLRTSADVATAGHDVFVSDQFPYDVVESVHKYREIPLGAAPLVGLFRNCYGTASFMVSKRFFIDMGGFTEDYGVGFEDYEFLSRVVLENHYLEAIPESLLWYRRHKDAMSYNTDLKSNQQRFLRAYLKHYVDSKAVEKSLLLEIQKQYFLEGI
jgi:GT2 family glycosyltransferase